MATLTMLPEEDRPSSPKRHECVPFGGDTLHRGTFTSVRSRFNPTVIGFGIVKYAVLGNSEVLRPDVEIQTDSATLESRPEEQ